jgi:hypothetical protein
MVASASFHCRVYPARANVQSVIHTHGRRLRRPTSGVATPRPWCRDSLGILESQV